MLLADPSNPEKQSQIIELNWNGRSPTLTLERAWGITDGAHGNQRSRGPAPSSSRAMVVMAPELHSVRAVWFYYNTLITAPEDRARNHYNESFSPTSLSWQHRTRDGHDFIVL